MRTGRDEHPPHQLPFRMTDLFTHLFVPFRLLYTSWVFMRQQWFADQGRPYDWTR